MRSIRSARIASAPATSALSSAWPYGSSEGPIATSYPRSRSMSTAGGGTGCVTTTRTGAPLQTSTSEAIDQAAAEGAVAVAGRSASADDVDGIPEDDGSGVAPRLRELRDPRPGSGARGQRVDAAQRRQRRLRPAAKDVDGMVKNSGSRRSPRRDRG